MSLIGIRTSIGGLVFDAVFKEDHTSNLTMTDHPVETGASLTDHAFIEPAEVSFEIGVSDSAIRTGSFGTGSRSVRAYQELLRLQKRRVPMTVVTRLRTYRNMLISSIIAPRDFATMHALKATIMMREIMIGRTDTVTVSPRASAQPQKTGSTNGGARQPDSSPPQQSILSQAASQLGFR